LTPGRTAPGIPGDGKVFMTIVVVSCCACLTAGCYAYNSFSVDDRNDITPPQCIYKIETVDGDVIECRDDSSGCASFTPGGIRCVLEDSTVQEIPLARVSRIYTRRPSPTSTVTSIVMVALIAGGLAIGIAISLGGSFRL